MPPYGPAPYAYCACTYYRSTYFTFYGLFKEIPLRFDKNVALLFTLIQLNPALMFMGKNAFALSVA